MKLGACPALPGLLASLFYLYFAFPAHAVASAKEDLEFAFHLMEREEYELALLELERITYRYPSSSDLPRLKLLSGLCHLEAGRHERARSIFEEVLLTVKEPAVTSRARLLLAEAFFRRGNLREAEYHLTTLIEDGPEEKIKQVALYRLGWTRLRADDWKEASSFFGSVKGLPGIDSERISREVIKGERLLLKDPGIAGFLAGILPGLGHVYVERYRDSAVSFILNAIFIAAAVESFREGQEVLGCIISFLELGWYTGNIYSAVNAAHKHNRRLKDGFRALFNDELKMLPYLSMGKGAGLGLTLLY